MSQWRGTLEFEVDEAKLERHNEGVPQLSLNQPVEKWDAAALAIAVEFEIVDFNSLKASLSKVESAD
jgi:hypothetical protein